MNEQPGHFTLDGESTTSTTHSSTLRYMTVVLNSIVVVFFAFFLAYTFVARTHLNSLAREFVTEKSVHYSGPVVSIAQQALESPLTGKLLSQKQTETIRNEIAEYHQSPELYIADLTRDRARKLHHKNADLVAAKVLVFKEKIRTFYDDTLNALIEDLRIFSVSNLAAGVIALLFVYRSPAEIRKPLVWFSFFIFLLMLYCISVYVDNVTFFRILFRLHMGWWYPALLITSSVGFYFAYKDAVMLLDPDGRAKDADGSPTKVDAT